MCTLVDLIVSCKSLKLSSLFFIFFPLCFSDWLHATAQSSNPLILSYIVPLCCWTPLLIFFILQHWFLLDIFYVSITFGIFTLIMPCFHVLLFMTIFWTPHWGNHLFPFHWLLVSGDSLTGTYSPVSSLSLTLYVGFCAWDKTVTSPSLDRLISCRRQTFSNSLA